MNVIRGAVDDQCGSAHFADNASEVGEQIVAELWLDKRKPALCAENYMQTGCWQMYEAESFAPLGLSLRGSRPTACAVGCILAPLCGFPMPLAAFCAGSRLPYPLRGFPILMATKIRRSDSRHTFRRRIAARIGNVGSKTGLLRAGDSRYCGETLEVRIPAMSVAIPHSGPVAQRLEQHTHNVLVLGSNPSRPTSTLYTLKNQQLVILSAS